MTATTFFLTGATGLLGRFILRELLRFDCRDVAVLVRPGVAESAAERVDAALRCFEGSIYLRRPRICSGSLSEPGLGLGAEDRTWLLDRNLVVIHCAASIRFVADEASGEPYRTNVDGMQSLLRFLQDANVAHFHQVSTAYVGARRGGTIREELVRDERLAGNDYERSKIRAESLVAECSHLTGKTIHRPSIIVGGSQDSFTSTYHGFYAPLQIGCQFAKTWGFSSEAGDWFRRQLGMSNEDQKNLVPVDWVASAIAGVVLSAAGAVDEAEVRGAANKAALQADSDDGSKNSGDAPDILHWTNPHPVACATMQEAIVSVIENRFSGQARGGKTAETLATAPPPNPEHFREQMRAYESYFASDPEFDTSHANRSSTAPVCPELTLESLRELAEFAIDHNFGWPKRPARPLPYVSLVERLRNMNSQSKVSAAPARSLPAFKLVLLGPGSPESLLFKRVDGRWLHTADAGIDLQQHMWTLTLPIHILDACIVGTNDISTAIRQGYAVLSGGEANEGRTVIEDWLEYVKSI